MKLRLLPATVPSLCVLISVIAACSTIPACSDTAKSGKPASSGGVGGEDAKGEGATDAGGDASSNATGGQKDGDSGAGTAGTAGSSEDGGGAAMGGVANGDGGAKGDAGSAATSISVSALIALPKAVSGYLATNAAGDIFIAGTSAMKTLPAGSTTWLDLPLGGLSGGQHGGFFFGPTGRLYSTNCGGDVIAIDPNATSWKHLGSAGQPGAMCTDGLLLDKGALYVGASLPGSGVYMLANDTAAWTAVGEGLDTTTVNALIRRKNGDLVAATARNGIMVLTPGATEWEILGTDGPAVVSWHVAEAPDGTLYATARDGVFRLDAKATAWKDVSKPMGGFGSDAESSLVIDATHHAFLIASDPADQKLALFSQPTNGTTWTRLATAGMFGSCLSLIADGKGGLLANCEGTVLKSTP